jgi:altronate dehydratase small subunit
MKAIIMKPVDNVCTVIETIEPGTVVIARGSDGEAHITAAEKIPFGHKIALRAIKKGEAVKKYGETIGLATRDILPGEHVHVHNLESCRGRGDK